jgi:hypothetical protein
MFFDCGDADFELKAFVDFVLLELGKLGIETFDVVFGRYLSAKIGDVVFGRHLAFDIGDVFGDRGETALHLSFKISEAALDGREDAVERRLGLLRPVLRGHMPGVYHIGRLGHECADRVDVTQHENRGKSARILEAGKR